MNTQKSKKVKQRCGGGLFLLTTVAVVLRCLERYLGDACGYFASFLLTRPYYKVRGKIQIGLQCGANVL
jgi:hypothetical protein